MKKFTNPWESQNPWQQGGAYHSLALDVPTSRENILPPKRCICQTGLTEDVFKDAFGLGNRTKLFTHYTMRGFPTYHTEIPSFLNELSKVFDRYEINNCNRKAHFLAQLWIETMFFLTFIEEGDGTRYDPNRRDDAVRYGNTEIGDGFKYKGRGGIHLTWKINYYTYFLHRPDFFMDAKPFKNLSQGVNFDPWDSASPVFNIEYATARPNGYTPIHYDRNFMLLNSFPPYERVAASLFLSLDTAGWFWKKGTVKNLNTLSDRGLTDEVSLAVNGGGNMKAERRDKTRTLLNKFNAVSCINM